MFVQLTSHMESMLEAAYTKYTNWQTKRSQLHVMKRTWPLRMTSRLCMSTYAVLRRLQKITQWRPLQRSNRQCSAVASASAASKVPMTFVPQLRAIHSVWRCWESHGLWQGVSVFREKVVEFCEADCEFLSVISVVIVLCSFSTFERLLTSSAGGIEVTVQSILNYFTSIKC